MTLKRMKVLLVDDDPVDIKATARALRGVDPGRFELRSADSVARARETLASTRVDLIVLDLGLPDSTGSATVSALLSAGDGAPIIAITGADDDGLGLECIDLGADDYLPKSKVRDDLLRMVEFALRRRLLFDRRIQAVVESLVEAQGPPPVQVESVQELVHRQLKELDVSMRDPAERPAALRRLRTLASKLAESSVEPESLLSAVISNSSNEGHPTPVMTAVLSTLLGQVYFERLRSSESPPL